MTSAVEYMQEAAQYTCDGVKRHVVSMKVTPLGIRCDMSKHGNPDKKLSVIISWVELETVKINPLIMAFGVLKARLQDE